MAYVNSKASGKVKAKKLIRSFESQDGLDPDKVEVDRTVEIEEEELKEEGNTARLAKLFGIQAVGEVPQKKEFRTWRRRGGSGTSSSDEDSRTRVTKVTRTSRREGYSDSDSEDERVRRSQVTTSVTTSTVTKVSGQQRTRDTSSDSDEETTVVRRVTKTSQDASKQDKRGSKFVMRTAKVDRDSSDERREREIKVVKRVSKVERDSSDERRARKNVKVVKKVTKVERDSSDERPVKRDVKVVKKTTILRDSSDDDSEDDKKVVRKVARDSSDERVVTKVVTVEKRKSKTPQRDSSEERETRRVSKRISKFEKRDSSEERNVKRHVVVTKRASKFEKRDSSDERKQRKDVKVIKKTSVVRREASASDSEDERRVKKVVVKKVQAQSSDSEEEVRKVKNKEVKVTKVTKVTKVEKQESDSEDERVVVKVKKTAKKVESDSDREVKVVKKVKAVATRASSDSEDERSQKVVTVTKTTRTVDKDYQKNWDVKGAKVTKTVRIQQDSSSSDEETVQKVQVKQIKVDKQRMKNKNVLVLFAHVFKESYEGALVGAAVRALKEQGADVQVSNLFEMGFNPVSSPRDFGGFVADREFYSYSLLAGQAKAHGKLAQDIVAEQDKVEWADMILIVSQLQSHGLPALLKGWFDRIMTYNFAFSDGQMYERGRLRGKKALLCLTSEALSSMYTPRGIHGDLNVYLWPILNGLFRFAGFDVLKPQVYFGVGRASDDYREHVIDSFQHRVRNIWDEKSLRFIPVDRFSEKRGYTMSDRNMDELTRDGQLTVGQFSVKTTSSMAIIVEPEKRRETAEKIVVKERVRTTSAGDKKPWHTMW